MILRRNPGTKLCAEISGGGATVSVRRPLSSQMSELCDACGPLAAPSANMYQKLSNTTTENAARSMPDTPILEGPRSQHGLESTIIDLTTQPYRIRRAGMISLAHLRQYVECVDGTTDTSSKAPGAGKHYQPSKPLRLNATHVEQDEALLCFGKCDLSAQWIENLSPTGNLEEAAYNLYYMLERLSVTDCQLIAVVPIPHKGIGVVINDKLLHATYK
jgi:L-threonylcarbamoyladenylate synthase